MDNDKTQLVDKLKTATNILVTVSRNPSVDQLAACVGLTLLLNKLGKHATAVFSGETPSTLEFLQPELTLEKTTDSLRDFIIALDKSKADKLRYKVEDEMVRIFITPYRVSLTDKDLEFSQGDFNVDVVIALGVVRQEDFDEAITAHGRILHDAVVAAVTISGGAELGGLNWAEPSASSLSEIVVSLVHQLGTELLDEQIATALLTGIVSETDRFSNEKTSSQTMTVSAELMAAGANQQLVATKLDESEHGAFLEGSHEAPREKEASTPKVAQSADGTLEIDHDSIDAVLKDLANSEEPAVEGPVNTQKTAELPAPVEEPTLLEKPAATSRLIIDPPSSLLSTNSNEELLGYDPNTTISGGLPTAEPAVLFNNSGIPVTNDAPKQETPVAEPETPAPIEIPQPAPVEAKPAARKPEPLLTGFTPPPPAWVPATQDETNQLTPITPNQPAPFTIQSPDTTKTLAEIEEAVHLAESSQPYSVAEPTLDDARDQVLQAINSQTLPPEPVQALGAQPLGDPLRQPDTFSSVLNQVIPPAPGMPGPLTLPVPPPETNTVNDPTAPPPVPPPIPFNFGTPPPPPQQ